METTFLLDLFFLLCPIVQFCCLMLEIMNFLTCGHVVLLVLLQVDLDLVVAQWNQKEIGEA